MPRSFAEILRTWYPGQHADAEAALEAMTPAERTGDVSDLSVDPDPSRRASSLRLALRFDRERLDGYVLRLLKDDVDFVRWHACEVSIDGWVYAAGKLLADRLVNDPADFVRFMAAVALGYLGDASALPVLRRAAESDFGTNHEGTPVSEAARHAIVKILARAEGRPGPDGGDHPTKLS